MCNPAGKYEPVNATFSNLGLAYPNIFQLLDVLFTGLANGQIMRWNSITNRWNNANLSIANCSDVSSTAPTNGHVLQWDSSTS